MRKSEVDFSPYIRPISRSGQWRGGLLLLLFCLTLGLYWHTLNQPYFWDDVPNLEFSISHTFGQIWTDVVGLPYYRPFTVTLNKIVFGVMPTGFYGGGHLLLVGLHALNSWLIGIATGQLLNLTRLSKNYPNRIGGLGFSQWAELFAGLLFVTYPFAALPIIQFGSLVHPLVTFFALSGVVAVFGYVSKRQTRWLLISVLAGLLAPYSHESGVIAGPVMSLGFLLVVAAREGQSWWWTARRNWPALFLLFVTSVLFVPIWFLVPKSRGEFVWNGWEGIFASLTFFSQSFSFPLQRISRLLIDRPEIATLFPAGTIVGVPTWNLGVIWLVSGVSLFLLCVGSNRKERGIIVLFGLAWTAMAALPNVVGLPFSYIVVSQRLLYLAGVPAVILWTVFLLDWGYPKRGWSATHAFYRSASAGLLFVAIAGTGIWYVNREIRLHVMALAPLIRYIEIVKANPDQQILILNPTLWINYRQAAYAMGHEGVSVSADYVDFDHLLDINTANMATVTAASFPDIKVELEDYYYATINERTPWTTTTFANELGRFDSVWITEYSPQGIQVLPAGWLKAGLGGDVRRQPDNYLARFDDVLFLTDIQTTLAGNNLQVALDWFVLGPLPNTTIFRHVSDCSGAMLGQGDGVAIGRTLPFDQLTDGVEIRDIRVIPLPIQSVEDCLQVSVGLFRPDGTRLTAVDANGVNLTDEAFSALVRSSTPNDVSPADAK